MMGSRHCMVEERAAFLHGARHWASNLWAWRCAEAEEQAANGQAESVN